MTIARRAIVIGLVVWAAATAVLVPFGHRVFGPDNAVPVALWACAIVVVTYAGVARLATVTLRRCAGSSVADGALFGALMCLPGLALDAALYALGGWQYPRLDAQASGAMAATLLFAYAAALAASLAAGARTRTSSGV